MNPKSHYSFVNNLWRHQSNGGWWFVSLPLDISREIRGQLQWQEEGWGRMRVEAQIGNLRWSTAIWFDTKQKTYLLPIKADVRHKEGLNIDDELNVSIWV